MVFFVELNKSLMTALENGSYAAEENDWPENTLKQTVTTFKKGTKYPVLSVYPVTTKLDDGSLAFKTLYLLPFDNGVMAWTPSQAFQYAGLEAVG